VVGINDLGATDQLVNLLKYDSVQGRFNGQVSHDEKHLIVNGQMIPVFKEADPRRIPWGELDVDVALESTGSFRQRSSNEKPGYDSHLEAGACRVVLSAPAKDEADLTVVLGVNDHQLQPWHRLISNASCTTNCLAPMAKVLHEKFGIVKGLMTTIHAYTNDQRIADLIHNDAYRARAAAINIIPTTTGAAEAVGKVIPELKGKLNGMAMRVPVACGSATDLTIILENSVTETELNFAMRKASEEELQGVLEYNTDPIVSSDIIGNPHGCIFDSNWTSIMDGNLAKVIGWYDNEWGYSCQTVEVIRRTASL
jgi:glyceraldehyde 3-phosphate dehydrogenase